MDNYSINSSDTTSTNGSFISKLRKLKIQERVLSANVYKSLSNIEEYTTKDTDSEIKKYNSKLRDSFSGIRNLLEDVKMKTDFQQNREALDINELKKDILDLESNIKSFKNYIQKEINSLRAEEQGLLEKINERSNEEDKPIGCKRANKKCYNEIVPSPVRAIINSPFKCFAVQQYQDFLKNSPNRNGGWNEYNHNTFISIWDKHFKDVVLDMDAMKKLPQYEDFKYEAMQKIPETTCADIDSHSNWYYKFIILKTQQQRALCKWQENNRKIKKRDIKTLQDKDSAEQPLRLKQNGTRRKGQNSLPNEIVRRQNKNTEEVQNVTNKRTTNFMTPTKQWTNRQESRGDSSDSNFNIDNISKLCIPTWRLSLL